MRDVQTASLVSADVERSEPHLVHPPSGRVERSEGRAFPQDSLLISVVMPCLNESRTLAECITEARAGCEATLISRSALASGSLDYEILIADNGSTDGSQEIAIANGARVIAVEQKGYGAALLGGFAAARGKYIVMGDRDSSYDFSDIPKLIANIEEGDMKPAIRLDFSNAKTESDRSHFVSWEVKAKMRFVSCLHRSFDAFLCFAHSLFHRARC